MLDATAGCARGHGLPLRRQTPRQGARIPRQLQTQTRTVPQQRVPRPQGTVGCDHGGQRVNALIVDASENKLTPPAISQPLKKPRQRAAAKKLCARGRS
jgi:hypothetical protein